MERGKGLEETGLWTEYSWKRGCGYWIWPRVFVMESIGSVCDGTQQKVEHMEYVVGGVHGSLGEIAVEEFNVVVEKKILGDSINHVKAQLVLQRRANVEALVVAEVPGQAGDRLVLNDYQASDQADGGGIKIERFILVFPGRYVRGKGGLAEEDQGKLGRESETPARIERKWVFKVGMARLAILQRWALGGTIWKVHFQSSTMVRLYSALASLSRNWRSTLWTLELSQDMMLLQAAMRWRLLPDWNAETRMELVST